MAVTALRPCASRLLHRCHLILLPEAWKAACAITKRLRRINDVISREQYIAPLYNDVRARMHRAGALRSPSAAAAHALARGISGGTPPARTGAANDDVGSRINAPHRASPHNA